MVGEKKEARSGIVRLALLVAVLLGAFVLVQQADLLPLRSSSPSRAPLRQSVESLKEMRIAMEEMKTLTTQRPWQELGACKAALLAAEETLKSSGGGRAMSEISSSSSAAPGKSLPCEPAPCSCADVVKDPSGKFKQMEEENVGLKAKLKELQAAFDRLLNEKSKLDSMEGGGAIGAKTVTEEALKAAKEAVNRCGKAAKTDIATVVNTKGYACEATEEDFARYFNYTVRGPCPDDWFFVQNLIFVKNCHALPRRRCISRTPRQLVERIPAPQALWDQEALNDEGVRWDLHYCKSFNCLNTRLQGDCRNCFNFSLERHRWLSMYRGNLRMEDVIKMKKGTLRIGLDAGGGTGSFAAQMAAFNVTILTTAMNIETVVGRDQGMPYMEAIALRGLIPLHLPHRARLPFFDNTLDVVHSVNSIKYLPLQEFEELTMEWDRVLRPGGIMWFEMFYAPVSEMPLYISVLELLGYSRLHWNLVPKPDPAERSGDHVYLNCIIEKPARED